MNWREALISSAGVVVAFTMLSKSIGGADGGKPQYYSKFRRATVSDTTTTFYLYLSRFEAQDTLELNGKGIRFSKESKLILAQIIRANERFGS